MNWPWGASVPSVHLSVSRMIFPPLVPGSSVIQPAPEVCNEMLLSKPDSTETPALEDLTVMPCLPLMSMMYFLFEKWERESCWFR